MRRICSPAILLICIPFFYSHSMAQANTTLSNLAAPTAVNADLLPAATNTESLGSATRGWNQLFVGNGIYLGGSRFVSFGSALTLQNTALGANALAATTSGTNNTALGSAALKANTVGFNNVAIGFNSLVRSTAGHNNVAVGAATLANNTSGVSNAAFGNSALTNNSSGINNMAIGANALGSNTTGSANIAIGIRALFSNKTLSYNVAVGDSALFSLTGGNGQNTGVGSKALYANTTGSGNVASGFQALTANTSGSLNTALGNSSLLSNTTGFSNTAIGWASMAANLTGFFNTAVGDGSLNSNKDAYWNTAVGHSAMGLSSSGNFNVAVGGYALLQNRGPIASFNTGVGYEALENTSNSQYNTAVGYKAGSFHDMGYNNTILGANCDINQDGLYNCIAIGQQVVCDQNSQARIGNPATNSIGGYADWTNLSDGRYKKNVQTNVVGLDFIKKLRPVTYTLDIAGINKHFSKGKTGGAPAPNAAADQAVADKEKTVWSGFVAQEVESAAKEAGYSFSGVDKPQNTDGLYGLRYAQFVVPLVKAVQQLSDSLTVEKEKNDSLFARVDVLAAELQELKDMIRGGGAGRLSLTDGALLQNSPNPVRATTTISYSLPQSYGRAKITITDMNGRVVKTILLTGSGNQTITVDAGGLSAGSYPYALYIDGVIVGTRQMLVVR